MHQCFNTWFNKPEVIDFWDLGGCMGPETIPKVVVAMSPSFLKTKKFPGPSGPLRAQTSMISSLWCIIYYFVAVFCHSVIDHCAMQDFG